MQRTQLPIKQAIIVTGVTSILTVILFLGFQFGRKPRRSDGPRRQSSSSADPPGPCDEHGDAQHLSSETLTLSKDPIPSILPSFASPLSEASKPVTVASGILPGTSKISRLPRFYTVFPRDGSKGNTEVDIIAVHGIETCSPKTWTAFEQDEEPRGREVNWLTDEDMLPSVVPQARIWVFDYNSRYSSNAQVIRIKNLGDIFLSFISMEKLGTRPIVFIGSCFGGLIIAQALQSAHYEIDKYKQLLQFTQGVVFLGTPFRGTRAKPAAEWRVFIAGVVGDDHEASTTLLEDLGENSGYLEKLVEDFGKMTFKYGFEIRCFFETRKTQILNAVFNRTISKQITSTNYILVERSSACLDCHEHIALEVRHAMMNKYRGPSDGNFKLVSGRIKEIFQKVQAIRILTKEELGYIQSLSSNYREHKDRNPKRVPGTCSWFLEHPIFRKWRDEGTENLLLVSADPGCGKSVLSRALVDERLVTSDEPTATTDVICYFFFKDDDTDRRSAAAALCALLHQLFKQRPTLLKHAMTDFEYHGDKIRGMFQTMWDILVKVAADPDAGRIICVLDALDECEESARQALIQELSGFHRARHGMKTQLKFLITSRPYSEIRGEFGSEVHDLPSISVKGEEESESISEEINLVITEEVTRIARARDPPINKELLDELVKRLKGMENRTYLWLHLILDEIRRSLESSPGKLGKLLQKISPSINAAYERILNRVPESNKIEAKRLLNIVVSAERPLTLEETNIALAIIEKKENVDKCDSENDLELDSQDAFILKVRNLCGLFINIVDSKVYLIHLTAREFLIRADRIHQHSIPAGAEASTWKVELDHSHFLMANICISYLLFPTFETCPNNVDEYCNEHALLKYAAMHWADHYRQAKVRGKTTLLESTINVCNHQSSQFRTWVQVYKHNLSYYTYFPDSANLLVGSYFGLEAVVERLLEKGADVALKDKEGRTALYSAAWNGHEAVVETLLQKGADVALKDKYGQTALYLAAQNGHEAVVEKLLQKGADVTLKDEDGQTALHSAAWNGHEAVVEALLQKGADVALKDKYGQTALYLAAQNGHEAVVETLLQKGADVTLKDEDGQTALHLAARSGHEVVVETLLQKGADVALKDKYRRTALHLAAQGKHEVVVKLLLDKGTDLESKDNSGQTTVSWAAENGHETVVKLLLDKGAEKSK